MKAKVFFGALLAGLFGLGSVQAQTYNKVTSASELKAGDKVIIVCEDLNVAMSDSVTKGSKMLGADVEIANGSITVSATAELKPCAWTLEANASGEGFAFKSGDIYLQGITNKTDLVTGENAAYYTITSDADGNMLILNGGESGRKIRGYENAKDFRLYSDNNGEAVQLYLGGEGGDTPTPSQGATYAPVSDASTLKAGDKILIAGIEIGMPPYTNAAMTSVANASNRLKGANVTINDDGNIVTETAVGSEEKPCEWTLVANAAGEGFALQSGNIYLQGVTNGAELVVGETPAYYTFTSPSSNGDPGVDIVTVGDEQKYIRVNYAFSTGAVTFQLSMDNSGMANPRIYRNTAGGNEVEEPGVPAPTDLQVQVKDDSITFSWTVKAGLAYMGYVKKAGVPVGNVSTPQAMPVDYDGTYSQTTEIPASWGEGTFSWSLQAVDYTNFDMSEEVAGPDFVIGGSTPDPDEAITFNAVAGADDVTDGAQCILVGAVGEDYFAMADQANNNRKGVAVSVTGTSITTKVAASTEETALPYMVTFGKSEEGYTMKVNASGLYLHPGSTSSNQLKEQEEPYYWSLSFEDGNAELVPSTADDRVLHLNPNNGSPLFACYKGTQNPVKLYKVAEAATEPVIRPNKTSVSLQYALNEEVSAEVIVNGELLTADVTVSVAGEGFSVNPATLDKTAVMSTNGAAFTVKYNGSAEEGATAVITLKSTGAADVTISVNAVELPAVATLEELYDYYETAQEADFNKNQVYVVKGDLVVTHKDSYSKRVYLQDAVMNDEEGASILVYQAGDYGYNDLAVGDVISGLRGTLTVYHGLFEVNPKAKMEAKAHNHAIYVDEVPMDWLTADEFGLYYQSAVVKITNVTFNEADGETPFVYQGHYTLADEAGNDMDFYATFKDADYVSGEEATMVPEGKLDVTGIVAWYDETVQFTARSLADIKAHEETSANEVVEGVKVAVYPNPALGRFVVNTEAAATVEVYNVLGERVSAFQAVAGANEVVLKGSGVYFVKVMVGERTAVRRVVIK